MTLLRVVCLALIVLGMLISAFLLARYFAIVSGTSSDGIDVCRAVFGADCDATLRSPLSSQIGIPLAGWGIVYYGTLAALLVMGWALGDTFEPEATVAALAVAVLAVIASLVLAVTMAVGWAPFCLMCAVVHMTNLALLFVLKAMTRQTLVQLIAALKSGGRYVLGERAAEPVQARWKVVVVSPRRWWGSFSINGCSSRPIAEEWQPKALSTLSRSLRNTNRDPWSRSPSARPIPDLDQRTRPCKWSCSAAFNARAARHLLTRCPIYVRISTASSQLSSSIFR